MPGHPLKTQRVRKIARGLPVANKYWLNKVSLNRILKLSPEVSCPRVPYSSVPARLSVAGCQAVPFFTRRTSVQPPPMIDSDHTENEQGA